ncbi:alcohol dehydrogenase catalytic domain-containing protein [Mycetocola zhadangensis]|uniref:alcohol dehydrogenase catalytic domain-containing protein n=1 Tax=Mycetocola zhadangensis TaxID=1164595 RepID=UPI001E53DD3A|nr:alcohol dehydrogenase catalytic domain-containing protein [Mycetocola zhadangensis]
MPADGVLIRVAWAGICGSDTSYWKSGRSGSAVQTHPFVLGHELSGTVIAVGDAVTSVRLGTAVTVHPASTTGPLPTRLADRPNLHPQLSYLGSAAVSPHRDGAFAEEIVVHESQVRAIPAGLSKRRAALAEPLAVALHAVSRAGDVAGQSVLVSGCGPVGALTIIALRAGGATEITAIDPAPSARERALRVGADRVFDVGEDLPGEYPIGMEASGAGASLAHLLRTVAVGGIIVQVGNLPLDPISMPLGLLVSRELELRGSYRFNDEMDRALAVLAETPAADELITHTFPLDQATEAFATASTGESSCKVLLEFDGS